MPDIIDYKIYGDDMQLVTTFLNSGQRKKHVAFGAPYPGKIISLELGKLGGKFLCQKDAFLCAARGIEIEVAFIHAGGTIIKRELQVNETLRVDTGCLVAFSPSVSYDIQFIGGFKNALFGGEGIFLAKMTGPGLVYLQSLPFSRLADRISAAARFQQKGEIKGVAGLGGKLLGGVLGGDRNI